MAGATPPATFTDATATGVIEATHGEINAYQEKVMKDISTALKQVPGKSNYNSVDCTSEGVLVGFGANHYWLV